MRWSHALIPLIASTALSGCGVPVKLAELNNGGDNPPVVTLSEVQSGNLGNLSRTETVVTTSGTDDVITRTNKVNIVLYEIVQPKQTASSGDVSLGKIADSGPPKPVFRLAATKMVKSANGQWLFEEWVNHNQDTSKLSARDFRIVAVNTGDKSFTGDVVVRDNLDGRIQFGSVTKASVIHDQLDLKLGLSLIPILGLASLAIDRYGTVDASPNVSTTVENGLLSARFNQVTLGPKDGILLEFSTTLTWPSLDEMRQTATPLQQRQ